MTGRAVVPTGWRTVESSAPSRRLDPVLIQVRKGVGTQLDGSSLSENLIYSSPRIFERRRRILAVTRDLIALQGYDGFNMRELCSRANVSQQTVYKAFENKERLVALAIRDHFSSFTEAHRYVHEATSLQGVIERVIVSDFNMRDMRPFVLAIVAIYFSPTADMDLRIAARTNILLTLDPWARSMADNGQLRKGMRLDRFMSDIIGAMFAVSFDWCRGDLSNEDFMLRKLEVLLACASGATRGQVRKEIDTYLTDLLGPRKLIAALQTEAVRSQAPAVAGR